VSDKESGRFLKKAAQKLLRNRVDGSETSTAQLTKFFASFCSRKEAFTLTCLITGAPAAIYVKNLARDEAGPLQVKDRIYDIGYFTHMADRV
jgi:hypothetical protein